MKKAFCLWYKRLLHTASQSDVCIYRSFLGGAISVFLTHPKLLTSDKDEFMKCDYKMNGKLVREKKHLCSKPPFQSLTIFTTTFYTTRGCSFSRTSCRSLLVHNKNCFAHYRPGFRKFRINFCCYDLSAKLLQVTVTPNRKASKDESACSSEKPVVGYPTPSEGWGHGERPWSPRSRATLQGPDQRS